MIYNVRIEWVCHHVWNTCNTDKFPSRGDKCVEFGCPFCGEKKVYSLIQEKPKGD